MKMGGGGGSWRQSPAAETFAVLVEEFSSQCQPLESAFNTSSRGSDSLTSSSINICGTYTYRHIHNMHTDIYN